MESASRQAVSEELTALGNLPSESELSALIERYAGSRRVSCEQADQFFASIGDVTPARRSAPVRDLAEVARGSWLDKLAQGSSAPPRGAAESASQLPALSLAAHAPMPEEPITIEHGLEHLPATTYSSAPPPRALPSEDTPVALPLSSHPAPPLAAADSIVVERWGMAETTPEPTPEAVHAEPGHVQAAPQSTDEDTLLDRWSDDLETILAQPTANQHPSSAPPPPTHTEPAAATDAPERWSAPHLGGDIPETTQLARDDDAPLSAAELSLLDQWSASDIPAPEAPPAPEPDHTSDALAAVTLPQPPLPPAAARMSGRPAPLSQRPAFAAPNSDHAELELEDEIELDPDDLIEDDSE